jgi:hypothetical protein
LVAIVFPALAIIISSFSCVGIFIDFACLGYDGLLYSVWLY